MKKYFLLIAAAATVFAVSCRKAREVEQVTTETPQEEIDDTTPQPVRFGSSLNVTVDTKAAVTNFATSDDLYVLGFEKGDNGFKFTEDEPFIPNVKANLATATDAYHPTTYNIDVFNPHGVAGEYFYYAGENVYDFFGYYLGGAYRATAQEAQEAQEAVLYADYEEYNEAKGTSLTEEQFAILSDEEKIKTPAVPAVPALPATVPVYNNGEAVGANGTVTKVAVPVVIDGTNDIMMAKTDHEFDVQNRPDDSKYVPENRMYSAYSARRTVKPNLKFEHQLSRFIFRTKKAGNVPTNHITIKQIALQSKTAGDLVLYEAGSTATLNFLPTGEASYIPLKAAVDADAVNYTDVNEYNQLNGTNLSASDYSGLDDAEKIKTPAQVAGYPATGHPGHGDYEQLGESIMVFPDAVKYYFKLSLEQKGISVGIPDMDLTIDLSSLADGKAIPGHQYTVDLLVYGAERVDVTVSLTPWVDAGHVEIDWDEDEDDNRPAGVITIDLPNPDSPALTIAQGGESDRFTITTTAGIISGSADVEGIALVPVAATYYDAAGAIAHNAGLTGALNSTGPLTSDQAIAYNTAIQPEVEKAAGDTLTAEEAAAYNANLTDAVSEGDVKEPAGYKVTVANAVTTGAHTLTVHSAGTFTVKPAEKDIAITVE